MWRIVTVIGVALLAVCAAVLAMAAYQPPGEARHEGKPPPRHAPRLEHHAAVCIGLDTVDNRLLHDQVSLCNLIDALWLEEDQLKEIIAVLELRLPEVEALAGKLLLARDNPGFGKAMAELRDTLMRSEEAGEELRHQVNGYAGPNHMMHLDYEALRREIAAEIMPILSENQLILLGEYESCLFNDEDPLHPENVGQASAASRGVNMLTRLRKAPEHVREQRLDEGLRRLADHAYKGTPFDIDIDAEVERLRGIAEEALGMSDEEFAVRAEELAMEMMAFLDAKDQMIADHYNIPTGMRDRRLGKLANTIVIPGALEIFQAELAGRAR